ncbi:MAG TPA: DUF5658 family protein [Gemmataceae bacterium]|nr:DUF5658 family protein [Gemmataceae bacterium]
MYLRLLPLPSLTLFSILSACDVLFTWLLMQWPNGKFQEANPIADAWLNRYGWSGLLAYKALAAGTVLGASLYIGHSQPRKADRLLTTGCLLVGGVLLYSYYLIQMETH